MHMTTSTRLSLTALIGAALLLASCAPRTATTTTTAAPTAGTDAPTVTTALTGIALMAQKAGLDVPQGALASEEFSLPDLGGKMTKLSSYRGKVVLLSFWATWCGPCKIEMPAMQALYDDLKGKGLEIVAVDVGEDAATVAAFLKANHYTFPVLLDTKGVVAASSLYAANAIPTNYVIDRKGQVVGRKIGIDGPAWTSTERRGLFESLLAP